jgi:hypothetical protein
MTKLTSQHFSPRASLCALGPKICSLKLFETISKHVLIKQKTIKHKPVDKLFDSKAVVRRPTSPRPSDGLGTVTDNTGLCAAAAKASHTLDEEQRAAGICDADPYT